MALMKKIFGIFLSLRTAVWLLLAMLVLMAFGAVQMPAMSEYESMNSMALLRWLSVQPLKATWWLWGLVGLLSLLTANTLLCSAESLIKKRQGRQWLLVISPQVIHIGFLFILLAHLMSSAASERWSAVAGEGTSLVLPNRTVLRVDNVDLRLGPGGFPTGWRADVVYLDAGGEKLREDFMAPNRPSFFRGLGVYIKDVKPGAVLLEVSREPGARWALVGSVLFIVGAAALSALKIRRER
jgi:cytochrome c biogenesis protein ResB